MRELTQSETELVTNDRAYKFLKHKRDTLVNEDHEANATEIAETEEKIRQRIEYIIQTESK